ncbi:hypothetical protein ACFE04_003749 [Oxalis oulophora]
MQSVSVKRNSRNGLEENTLAIIDHSDSKDSHDRFAFLEAVRASSFAHEDGAPPTNKMYEAVFDILKEGKSLELVVASYQLLIELDKRFPRVSVSRSTSENLPQLLVVEQAWSPFLLTDVALNEESSGFDLIAFHELIQDISVVLSEANMKVLAVKPLQNLLLFQYLVSVLDGDFLPRNGLYKETKNWGILRQSFLNMLLGSRRLNYKAPMKDCIYFFSIACELYHRIENPEPKSSENCDTAMKMALVDISQGTCSAMKKFLISIMELDLSRKEAEMEGCTTRADGIRTPLVELILDELTYNEDILAPFLQVFNESKWKLDIILLYFLKYITKPSSRTRKSSGSDDETTFSGVLKSFSKITSTKSIVKKLGTEVIQLLLAHAFQAFLALSSDKHNEEISDSSAASRKDNSVSEICKDIISAFKSLRTSDREMEISPFGKEALFTAAGLLKSNS